MLFGGLQIRGLFSGLAKNMGYSCWDPPLAWPICGTNHVETRRPKQLILNSYSPP